MHAINHKMIHGKTIAFAARASAAARASSGGTPADKVAGEVSFRGFGPWPVALGQCCALPRGFPSSTHPSADFREEFCREICLIWALFLSSSSFEDRCREKTSS